MQHDEKDILGIGKHHITIVDKLPDYSDDPFFLKKEEEAFKALTEIPLPQAILDRIEGPSILKKTKN